MIEFIDLYCERTGPGFWNEPVNALSNLGFPIAALVAWVAVEKRGNADILEWLLIPLAAFIGVGSFLFHTHANSAAELADVVPIWSFVGLYTLAAIYRMTGETLVRTARIAGIALCVTLGVVIFTGGDVVSEDATSVGRFNGSLQYAPALLALSVFALIAYWKGHAARRLVLFAAVVFAVSLVMRTIDLDVCGPTGIGTHFLWHLLNAIMVGALLLALIWHLPPERVRNPPG